MDGVTPAGYEGYGDKLFADWPQASSPELLALGWKPRTLEEWANDAATKAVFAK